MNIHEHQAKEILKQFGAQVPNGVVIFNIDDIENKTNNFKSTNLVVKAQIHAGGRGKAGGIKIVNNKNELIKEAKKIIGATAASLGRAEGMEAHARTGDIRLKKYGHSN